MANTDTDSERFTVFVNYDDPRWRTIQRDDYARVNRHLYPCHFPINGRGTSEVIMECIAFDDYEPRAQDVMIEISKRGLRLPDRAETESFLDQYPEAQRMVPVIGLCGSVWARDIFLNIGFIDESYVGGGRTMNFTLLTEYWDIGCCFLAVRPA